MRSQLLLNPEIVLVVVGRLQRARRKCIQTHRQRACRRTRCDARTRRRARVEDRLKVPVRIAVASSALFVTPGAIATPPTCPPMPPTNVGRIRSVRCRQIRDLRGNDVVEDAEPCMADGSMHQFVCHRNTRLPRDQRRGGKQPVHVGLNRLIERLVQVVRRDREMIPPVAQTTAAGLQDSYSTPPAGRPSAWRAAVGLYVSIAYSLKISCRDSLFQRNRKRPALGVSCAVGELRQIVINRSRHSPFAEVVVAHIDAPRIHAESISVFAARPIQVVVDLPLRHLAPLRIGVVIPANRS